MIVIDFFIFWCFFNNFGDVGTHNEAKMVPNPEKSSFWHTLPALFRKNEVFSRRVCVTARSLTHTLHAITSLFRKSAGRVCQNQPQASKTPLQTCMGAQSTKSRIYCFSYSRMVDAISRRVLRCFEKVVPSRPDRPTNAIAQPDRPDIDRKKLHRPARSTSTSSEQLSSTTNSTI